MNAKRPTDFNIGDRVNWDGAQRGGYGLSQTVAAVVLGIGKKLVQIDVRFKPPYSRSPVWESASKWVSPEHLSPRIIPSAAFGEAMTLDVDGFTLTPWKHPHGVSRLFKDGVFYGAIDGYACTAPCNTREQALVCARHSLLGGGYRAGVLDAISVRRHWLATGQISNGKIAETQAEIDALQQRLLKLFTAYPDQCRDGDPPVAALRDALATSSQSTMRTETAWPDDCGLDLAAEKQRAEQVASAAAAWRKAWPAHCPACGGWGGSGFTEMHGFKGGSGEQLFDRCGALPDAATCHRCGQDGLAEDGDGPCAHCGWDYNDGVPQ